MFCSEKLGPQATIAKEIAERKEESQKRPEKCAFFREVWKSPLKQRVASDSNGDTGVSGDKLMRNLFISKHMQTHSVPRVERLSKSLAP